MKKTILGLDLGTNSIGWALVEIDELGNPIRIIAMGSRIIPLNSNDRDQFQKGQAISKNQDRTTARTQRKGYDRKQLRKFNLKKVLTKYNIMPNFELMNMPMLELWKLRSDAVNEEISAEQLGRILYMFNQKRGYKSARSEANIDKKDTDYVAAVNGRYADLKDKNQTIGQYFYTELNNGTENNTYFRTKDRVYPREAYIEEFDKIIATQRSTHSFLTEEVIDNLKNEIVFYQRKLKSQKGLVSICEFEGFHKKYIDKVTNVEKITFTGPKVAPKTSPLYQLCKIWENVNNMTLKVKNEDGSKYKWGDFEPSLQEKTEIANYLFKNDGVTYDQILKILNLNKQDVFANKQIKNGLKGNITYAAIKEIIDDIELLRFDCKIVESKHIGCLLDKKTGEILEEKEALQIDSSLENEPLYQLWHTIYSIKDLDECKVAIIKNFNICEEQAINLARIDFNKQAFA
jgi:CRISPR-associated endonuclease Csn1